jgi:hypothetical protein
MGCLKGFVAENEKFITSVSRLPDNAVDGQSAQSAGISLRSAHEENCSGE